MGEICQKHDPKMGKTAVQINGWKRTNPIVSRLIPGDIKLI